MKNLKEYAKEIVIGVLMLIIGGGFTYITSQLSKIDAQQAEIDSIKSQLVELPTTTTSRLKNLIEDGQAVQAKTDTRLSMLTITLELKGVLNHAEAENCRR